jgi:serine/threonine-protein kinase
LERARQGRKPWPSGDAAWKLYWRLVHGLSQFHDFTMCAHGDITPWNLIVQAEPQRLRLIDFGSAWYEENAKRREAGDGHTRGYAAPEVRDGGRATTLVDQFSTTAVLYEMLTGQLPYEGMGGRAGWPEHLADFRDAFQAPSGRCRGDATLPKSAWRRIDSIVATALALNPDDRFATSNVWRDAVDEVSRVLSQSLAQPLWQKQVVEAVERVVSFLRRGDRSS